MARTWSWHSTHSVVSGSVFAPASRALVNDAGTEMYFVRNGSPQKVYKFDGTSLTDLTGSNFPTTTDEKIWDICVFDGELFLGYGVSRFAGGPGTDMYRYTSGTSWTNEYTLAGEPANPDPGWIAQPFAADDFPWAMDCDDNYMAVAGNLSTISSETFRRMWTRDTGGNWSITQMPGPSYPAPGYQLVGKSKGSDYSGLVGYNRLTATNYQPVLIGGPSPWTNLTGAGIGLRVPIGYGNGFSFFSQNIPTGTATWELKYSNDWGDTLFDAGGLTRDGSSFAAFKFKNIGGGVIMLSLTSHQAYTWDADTATFIEDGQTTDIDGNRAIYDFFRLNGQLYALTNSVTANSVEIWTASEPACQASFYYGVGIPAYTSDLPFCVQPGGLAISPQTQLAVLGTIGEGSQSVVYGQAPYVTWNDISGIVPTGSSVTSIKFV